MAQIHKGDQLAVAVKLTYNGEVVTTTNCADVRIQIGSILKQYTLNELTFDSTNNLWLFPLTEAQTKAFPNVVEWQEGIKLLGGTNFLYGDVKRMAVSNSIITATWNPVEEETENE